MAVKTLQNLVQCVANDRGVHMTGMLCKNSMRAAGSFSAPISFLPSLPFVGPYPPSWLLEDSRGPRTGRSATPSGVYPAGLRSLKPVRHHQTNGMTATATGLVG